MSGASYAPCSEAVSRPPGESRPLRAQDKLPFYPTQADRSIPRYDFTEIGLRVVRLRRLKTSILPLEMEFPVLPFIVEV